MGAVTQLSPTRPTIRVGVDLGPAVTATVAALAADPRIYQRDGRLVDVVEVADDDPGAQYVPVGSPRIRHLPAAVLRVITSEIIDWRRFDARAKKWVPTRPDRDVLPGVYEAGSYPGVRHLAGVVETPTLRPDWSVIDTPGYDPPSGYLYRPMAEYPAIPAAPSQSDANAALMELAEVWRDFSWASSEMLYVPIAATLTILARPAIAGPVPAVAFDASAAGAGKGLAAQCVAVIATGREAPALGWPEREEEREKVLGALALRHPMVTMFDNAETPVGGSAFERCLTATRVQLRVLGNSEAPDVDWRCQVMLTGNGIAYTSDAARRTLHARQEPRCERPEERSGPTAGTTWTHDPLLPWARQHRADLVAAGLRILRGWDAAGRPSMGLARWGSFEAWASSIPAAIVWAGGEDILACRARSQGSDSEAAHVAVILADLERMAPDGSTARSIAEALWPEGRPRHDAAPDGYDSMRDALEAVIPCRPGMVPTARQIGDRLRRWRGRVAGGRQLHGESGRGGRQIWRADPC